MSQFCLPAPQPWSWPVHMQIELTNYCNLKCPVCPTGIGAINRKPLAMDVSLFEQLMDEVGQYLLTLSLWGWGESILHPQLAKILRIALNTMSLRFYQPMDKI